MNERLKYTYHALRHRAAAVEPGQSMILIALLIVILVGIVGLSVDVGNTYAEQRQVVRAANAAAVEGMQTYRTVGATDVQVWASIQNSFTENGITTVPFTKTDLALNERRVEAYYLDLNGNRINSCRVGSCGEIENAAFIEVYAEGDVETYFARVLGQEELPVSNTSYAGVCPPINGVLPIAINHNLIDPDGGSDMSAAQQGDAAFAPNARSKLVEYPDLPGRYSVARLYFEVPGAPSPTDGEFGAGFLRWQPTYDEDDLNRMLGLEGSLRFGFDEVPDWPAEAPAGVAEVENYPLQPQYLTEYDWVWGLRWEGDDPIAGEGLGINDFAAEMQQHIESRNRVILPLYEAMTLGNTQDPLASDNPAFLISQFGEFFIVDFDRTVAGAWIDLAMIDYAPRIPCPTQNVEVPPNERYGVRGDITIRPRWVEKGEEFKPAGYTMMMDVSGSMNLSFNGWGIARDGAYKGRIFQCESKDPENPQIPYSYEVLPFKNSSGDCADGNIWAPWSPVNERRAYAARNTILDLADNMRRDERIRVVNFNQGTGQVSPQWYGNEEAAFPDFRYKVLRDNQKCPSWRDTNDPCYHSGGGTNGASALLTARDLMLDADFPRDDDGKDLRRVAIYLTDGVSNRRSDNAGLSTKPACQGLLGNEKKNTAFCQIGYDGSRARPITEMMEISADLHDQMDRLGYGDFALYFVAMGRVDTTGADQIATSPDMVYQAADAAQLSAFFSEIQQEVQEGACIRGVSQAVSVVNDSNRPDPGQCQVGPSRPGISDTVFGYIDIETSDGALIHEDVPLTNQVETGRLGFSIPAGGAGLQPGSYRIVNPVICYDPQGNGNTQTYERMLLDGIEQTAVTFTVSESRLLGDTAVVPTIEFDLFAEQVEALCDALD